MATKRGVSSINLLPKDSFEFSTLGKVLKWATTVGRVLVVMTEFVVLLAFGSRFYFDKKLDDLGEELTQKEAQIAAYADVETQMRKVLAKQQPVDSFMTSGINFSDKIDELSKVAPSGTVLDTFDLNSKGINITGKSQSEYGFAQFLSGLKQLKGVTSINMQDTSYDQISGKVKFSIQLAFKNG